MTIPTLKPKLYFRNAADAEVVFDNNLRAFCNSFANVIAEIHLRDGEAVFVYKNHIYIHLSRERDCLVINDKIIDVLQAFPLVIFKSERDVLSRNKIPKTLWPLLPLLEKYRVSDDAARDALILEMGDEERRSIVDLVSPHLTDINLYLDSFIDKPLTTEAQLIGDLAELVSEMKGYGVPGRH